jgi:carboxyl-terminal processing protease
MELKKNKFPIIGLVLLSIGIILGIIIQKFLLRNNINEGLRKFDEVLTYTEKYYVESVDDKKLIDAAINGLVDSLDPHSVYISAENMKGFDEQLNGNFEGIGIEFQVVNDTLTVVSPISGGPSEALGIMAGDRIISIDGKGCIGITNEQVRQKLRGPAGTKVTISVYRPSIKGINDYNIIRDKIPLYSVDCHFMYDNKTGYLSLSRFSETSTKEVVEALDDLRKKGMQRLVLDLRNNPGGLMKQAVQIADIFIDDDKMIVYTKGRRSDLNEKFYAKQTYPYEKIPLIILVNSGSASASEIVAGSTQDWDRGLVVGETTFGKGLVQHPFTLPDSSVLRLTILKYYTPSGRLIQRDYSDKKSYYTDTNKRYEEEGDNLEHKTEKDSSKPIFKTKGGRIVYGGGGITPDYIIKSDRITSYSAALRRANTFYEYVLSYKVKNNKEIKKKYSNSISKFNKEYNFSDEDLNAFLKFASSKKIEFNKNDFEKDNEFIRTQLKAYVARNIWQNNGWYQVMLGIDNQFKKAINQFYEAEKLANL